MTDYASAGRVDDLRDLTPDEASELREHRDAARNQTPDEWKPFRLNIVAATTGAQVLDGLEHAVDGGVSLCGIPERDLFLMRHHFDAMGLSACPGCSAQVGR